MKRQIITTILSLAVAFSAAVHAAPEGYSINSDSPSGDADNLYRIDLATGAQTKLGLVQSLGKTKIDVEGLAFAPDGTLYGVDDDSMTLFPINTANGSVVNAEDIEISGMPSGGGNDFGLTFACDGNLYATSVSTKSLYRIGLDGNATVVGSLGPNLNISALAAYGNPVKLYGLGNGLTAGGEIDSRTLYEINTQTGLATAKPQELGAAASAYNEAGLSFDSTGQLWAITDRRAVPGGPFGSQVLRVDTVSGAATLSSTTAESGFESLAIANALGCGTGGSEEPVNITINKEWFFDAADQAIIDTSQIGLACTDVKQGDGVIVGNTMTWEWNIKGNASVGTTVYPDATGGTFCHVTETVYYSAIEVTNDCANWFPVAGGDDPITCTITNTVFLEGIPTLGDYGKLLFVLLILATGMVAVRRT